MPPLIAPDWNWNFLLMAYLLFFCVPLIAPDWNWNLTPAWIGSGRSWSFNCTRLELKLEQGFDLIYNSHSFNCTRLELKHLRPRYIRPCMCPFNCTRLELKPYWFGWPSDRLRPLIAPDWNWNALAARQLGARTPPLIAPDWNWNKVLPAKHNTRPPGL